MQLTLTDDHVGATQAAAILGISRVTLHRWVKQGVVKAYTLGPRRVLIRRSDLSGLVRPAGEDPAASAGEAVEPEPLTAVQVQAALSALEHARLFRAQRARRSATP